MKSSQKRGIWSIAIIVVAVGAVCWSCNGNKTGFFGSDADSTCCDSDSIAKVIDPDTLALDAEVKAGRIPTTMDETFDDFIYAFDQSNRLQRERICFPLPFRSYQTERNHKYIRTEWNHRSVFMGEDFSISLWNNTRQMTMAKDTSLLRVCLQQIHLEKREIMNYHFSRDTDDGKWMLDSIGEITFAQHKLPDFLEFFREWVSDSTFQMDHVANAIDYATLDDNSDEMIVGTIDAEQWQMFAPVLPKDVITCIDYGQLYTDRQRVLFQMRGINNGLESTFTFIRKNDSWELTAFEN